jgi:O-antigen/teichoic acid export membrane protein
MLCSAALLFQPFDVIIYWFQNRYESKVTSVVTLVAYIFTTAYKVLLLVMNKSIQWFAFATSVDYILVTIFLIYAYKKRNGPKLQFKLHKCKQLLEKSQHYILAGMMIAIYGQTDKFMLRHMLDETAVGHYSLATTINNMWVFVLAAIIDSMCPTILRIYAEKDQEGFDRKNRQLYAIVIYVACAVALCFVFFGKPLIRIFYGEAYIPAYDSLKCVVWYTVFSYLGVARNAWIVCENKQKYLKYLYISAAAANIVLNWLCIPLWGAAGAAFASFITQFAASILIPLIIKPLRPNVKLMIDAFLLKGIR